MRRSSPLQISRPLLRISMALSRYETRKDLVLAEANAIGTTALRAGLLTDA